MIEARPIPLILDQHAEDCAVLWLQRDAAVNEPHYNRTFLARLDEHLEAHVDGLRIAGPHGWDAAFEAWESATEPEELFALAVLAFDMADDEKIETLLDILKAEGADYLDPIVAALGWLPLAKVEGIITAMLGSSRATARLVGLGGASAHRHDPGDRLAELIDDDFPRVRARAARLAGELGRADLRDALFVDRDDDTADSLFWVHWAATMLGDRDAGPGFLLGHATDPENADWERAFRTGILAAGPDHGWQWLDHLPLDGHGITLRILGFGLLGEVKAVDWLISQMDAPEYAAIAGEAYSMITGTDLAYDDLDMDPPDDAEVGPNDDPADEDVEMDPNEDLPLPNPALVARHWAALQPSLPEGRLFLGRPRSPETFEHGFMTGYQRQRRAAAYAMALASDGAPLRNWKVPVFGISLF